MRTTLTLDKDVAVLLEQENKRSHEPMKHTVNRALRAGLRSAKVTEEPKQFVVTPLPLGTAEQWQRWQDMSAQEILDDLDGEFQP